MPLTISPSTSYSNRRILIIAEFDRFGGTRTYFIRLLEMHAQQGIPTAVLIEKKCLDDEILHLCEKYNFRIFLCSNRTALFKVSYLAMIYEVFCLLKPLFAFRPSLIHVSSGSTGSWLTVLLLRMPCMLVLHAIPFQRLRFGRGFVFRMQNSKKTCIAPVSKACAEALHRFWNPPRESVSIVSNGVDIPEQVADTPEKIILTMGHMEDYKNPDAWFQTAQEVLIRFPDYQFIWLGDGSETPRIQSLVEKAGLKDRIILMPFCSNPSTVLKRAWLYFQPSKIESQGLSVLEAMSHGIPCVVSTAGGLVESIDDGVNGFCVETNNIARYADRINILLENRSERDRLGANARNKVISLFSRETQEKKIMKIYDDLTRNPAKRNSKEIE